MQTTTQQLQLSDIQGIILTAYGHLDYASFVFLNIQDGAKGRALLGQLLRRLPITSAAEWKISPVTQVKQRPETTANLAVTYPGLVTLGVSEATLKTFPADFTEGMAARSEWLGDSNESAPENWELGGPKNEAIHLLVMLYAQTAEQLADLENTLDALISESAGGVQMLLIEHTDRFDKKTEHFGFLDGISQPVVEGSPYGQKDADTHGLSANTPIKAGEFILGYLNEYEVYSPMPDFSLGQNGSYLVYRKLAQHVDTFHEFLKLHAGDDQNGQDYLAAKIIGRWYSGAPLVLSPDHNDPGLAKRNDFGFLKTDPYGYACPVGSHIRRANPRDSLQGDPEESVKTSNRHRLIRRGRSYGPAYTPDNPSAARGLCFIGLQADISGQFEFLQRSWIDEEKFATLYNDKDPLVGDQDGKGQFTIQRYPVRRRIQDMPRFVTVLGGAYFFVPGLSALNRLAQGWPNATE